MAYAGLSAVPDSPIVLQAGPWSLPGMLISEIMRQMDGYSVHFRPHGSCWNRQAPVHIHQPGENAAVSFAKLSVS